MSITHQAPEKHKDSAEVKVSEAPKIDEKILQKQAEEKALIRKQAEEKILQNKAEAEEENRKLKEELECAQAVGF